MIGAEPRSGKGKALAQWASRNRRGRKLQRGWWTYSGEMFVKFPPYRYRCVGRPVAARYLLSVSIGDCKASISFLATKMNETHRVVSATGQRTCANVAASMVA